MIPMELLNTCCSVDENELVFPSFSVVFIHTFAVDSNKRGKLLVPPLSQKDYEERYDKMTVNLKSDPAPKRGGKIPVDDYSSLKTSSIAELQGHQEDLVMMVKSDVEKLLFTQKSLDEKQIVRYSAKGFNFRIPVRSDAEKNKRGAVKYDFESADFEGHANVEISQFFDNIFSVTYRFLFDGNACRVLRPDIADKVDNLDKMRQKERNLMGATVNHVISFLASYLGAEYWTSDPFKNVDKGTIDFKCRLLIDGFWLDADGRPVASGKGEKNVWVQTNEQDDARVFDSVALRYKKFIISKFDEAIPLDSVGVNEDSRYAMVDIWESIMHPYKDGKKTKDLFGDTHDPRLGEAGIIRHIRDYHRPELVGLLSMYPAEWPYRDAEAFDEVCGDNIAIDVDDLVLAGSHVAVVFGTYALRGDGVNGVNWKKIMRERRLYHVSWEEYLLILQFVLAKKHTLTKAVDRLLHMTSDMAEVTKKMIGDCSKAALAASKKVIELDVVKQMKFPSHKVMYDRTMRRLRVDEEFERFKDVQEVVTGSLQSIGEYHAAKADYKTNTALIAISVLSLFELLYQTSEMPFIKFFFEERYGFDGRWPATVLSALSGFLAVLGFGWVIYRVWSHSKESKEVDNG